MSKNNKLLQLKASLEKKGFSTELSKPDVWASWGNMAINFNATQSFYRGIPNRRLCMLYGPSGTGKSFLLGNAIRDIQSRGYKIIFLDTEDAVDPDFLKKIGVDVDDEDKFLPIRLYTIEQLSEATADIFQTFDKEDKIAVIVDSLGMLETDDHFEAFEKKGEMKNDMGLMAKKTKKYLKNVSSKVGNRDCFFLVSQHSYKNQDIMDGRGANVVSGGDAQVYIPSITLLLKKTKLKEEESGSNGKKAVAGINLTVTVEKSRFNQMGLECKIKVPYKTGMDQFDGVLDILVDNEVIQKNGAWYSYEIDGETVKFQRKNAQEHLETLVASLEEGFEIEEDEEEVVGESD